MLEWIQYQLDTAGSVADILASDARTHMVPLTAAANHALVRGSTKKTSFPRQTPDAEIAAGARYGFSAACPGGTR